MGWGSHAQETSTYDKSVSASRRGSFARHISGPGVQARFNALLLVLPHPTPG